MESTPLFDVPILRQDNQPDNDNIVMWVDTSGNTPETKIRDENGNWTSVVPNFPIFVTQEAVSFTESDVSLSTGSFAELSNGSVSMSDLPEQTRNMSTDYDFPSAAGYHFTPEVDLEIDTAVVNTSSGSGTYDKVAVREAGGADIESFTNVSAGTSLNFTAVLSAGVEYQLYAENPDSFGETDSLFDFGFMQRQRGWNNEYDDTYQDMSWVFDTLRFVQADPSALVTVGFSDVEDLTAWDRVSWQSNNGDGSITATIQTDDGTGWSDFATNVAPPYSIKNVPVSDDVRVQFDLSRPSVSDTSPLISYVARRGER